MHAWNKRCELILVLEYLEATAAMTHLKPISGITCLVFMTSIFYTYNFTFHKQITAVNYSFFRCPDEAIRMATATMNMSNMLTSNMYVLFDDLLYSPNRSTPQKVLTSGRACHRHLRELKDMKEENHNTRKKNVSNPMITSEKQMYPCNLDQ